MVEHDSLNPEGSMKHSASRFWYMLIALTSTSGLLSAPDINMIISDAHHSDIIIRFGTPSRKKGPQLLQLLHDHSNCVSVTTEEKQHMYSSSDMSSTPLDTERAIADPRNPIPQ